MVSTSLFKRFALPILMLVALGTTVEAGGFLQRLTGPGKQLQAPVAQPPVVQKPEQPTCPDGKCPFVAPPVKPLPGVPTDRSYVPRQVYLTPLTDAVDLEGETIHELAVGDADRLDQVIRATVRVTVGNVCGSGTVVGRAADGSAIVLTNAHVVGTTKGRVCNVERWNSDGTSERSTGALIAAGYGQGMSIDFALLKCTATFAKDVRPIPLADRYPNANGATTYGCPRCEWPSLQVVRFTARDKQILTWKPEAIGGRSGSSVVDYTNDGPRVVGLLTWGGGGEGLGQSTPFLLSAMRGRLPAALEPLPPIAREVPFYVTAEALGDDSGSLVVFPVSEDNVVDRIIEDSIRDRIKPSDPILPLNPDRTVRPRPILEGLRSIGRTLLILLISLGAGLAVGYGYARYSAKS